MVGRRINAQQVKIYMEERKKGKTQITAAAQAGFCERTARNLQKRNFETTPNPRTWRTRTDPIGSVWEEELVPMLEREPGLQARTLLEHLQEHHPDDYPDSLLRTLQRRVRKWKALCGPEKEIIFSQNHPPGWQGISDFTEATELDVTIRGKRLEHRFYHYRLAYSGWEYAQVILGGESYTALAEGLQNALRQSLGAPQTHRTDSLSAAYKNLSDKEKEAFTQAYQNLIDHYGIEATRNNKGVSHENGTIEASNRHFKSRVKQALMVRANREFPSIETYKQFIQDLVKRHNRRIHNRYREELPHLQELPIDKAMDYSEASTRVTTFSTIRIKHITYSVPSRLIGMTLKVHIYDDRLECFVGNDLAATLKRQRQKRQIDYRHVIHTLVRKPQAFANYIYQEELFPTLAFRQAWESLTQAHTMRKACSEYVRILKEAALHDEATVNAYLEKRLDQGKLPRSEQVQALFRERSTPPKLETPHDELSTYDKLRNPA